MRCMSVITGESWAAGVFCASTKASLNSRESLSKSVTVAIMSFASHGSAVLVGVTGVAVRNRVLVGVATFGGWVLRANDAINTTMTMMVKRMTRIAAYPPRFMRFSFAYGTQMGRLNRPPINCNEIE